MSKNITHPDFIDAYLKQKLSEAETIAFEKRMQRDPLLQNEVNLQREIVASLSDVRKAELKARLDAIPVDGPVAWYGMSGVKWTAAAITAITLGVSAYLYFSPEDEMLHQPNVSIVENTIPVEPEAKVEKPVPNEEFAETDENQSENDAVVEEKTALAHAKDKNALQAEQNNTIAASSDKEQKEEVKLPEIVRPNIVADFDDDFQAKEYDDVEVPEKGVGEVENVSAPAIGIENEIIDGYDFHYSYKDNKLFLYGDFKDIPYEILALNTAESTRLFLKYDSSFYRINQSQTEIIPLEPIKNQDLIRELKIVSDYK